MKRRQLCALLSALFLFVLCIPCGAAGSENEKAQAAQTFSDVPETLWCAQSIRVCNQAGLLNGTSASRFSPGGPLTMGQLLSICARLRDLRSGGTGVAPSLPEAYSAAMYYRFYDADGKLFANYDNITGFQTASESDGSCFLFLTDDASSDQDTLTLTASTTCTLKVGLDGYGTLRTYSGTRETLKTGEAYSVPAGQRYPDFSQPAAPIYRTGFRFSAGTVSGGETLSSALSRAGDFSTELSAENQSAMRAAWWFPAAFSLWDAGCFSFSDLVGRQSSFYTGGIYSVPARFTADAVRREDLVRLLHAVTGDLPVIDKTAAPDVSTDSYAADAISNYYQSGIVSGMDAAGNFRGSATLTRGQAAAILARVLQPSLRLSET